MSRDTRHWLLPLMLAGACLPALRARARRCAGVSATPARHGSVCGSIDDAPAAGMVAFAPQYPLWSDGATKRRWIRLPAGHLRSTRRDPTPGTSRAARSCGRSSRSARRVETRYIERLPTAPGATRPTCGTRTARTRVLAPERGVEGVAVDARPAGATTFPSRADCRACHEGRAMPVLGFSALQLSPDRDPLAPHAERPRHGRRRSARARRARPRARSARGAARARRRGSRPRRRERAGAGLPARQLRPLPQRRAARSPASSCALAQSRGRPARQRPALADVAGRREPLPRARAPKPRAPRAGRRPSEPSCCRLRSRIRSPDAAARHAASSTPKPSPCIERWIREDLATRAGEPP